MNDTDVDPDQSEETTLTSAVSDEALEAAFGTRSGATPTLLFSSYCFTCGQGGEADRQSPLEMKGSPHAAPSRMLNRARP
jgi:hypothetical protein